MTESLQAADLILIPRWLMPIQPRETVLEDHAVALKHGQIVALGPREEISARFRGAPVQRLDHHVLMPGLVNAHGHAAMSLMRGFADDHPLMVWLNDHIWPTEGKFVSEAFVADGTSLAMAEMLATGTTTFADMYFFPEVAARVVQNSGMRAQVTFPILDFPTAWGSGPDEYFRKGLALFNEYRSHPRVKIGFGPHAPYTVSDDALRQVVTYAQEVEGSIQIHVHETAGEVEESLKLHGMRPIERLRKLGLLSPLTQCVHMTQVDDADIAAVREHGAHIVHCPESNMKLASGMCPVQKLLDSGINVALGTDGAASNNDLDLFSECNTAALLAKLCANDASALNAFAALEMATLGGAKALGMGDQIGSIEVGKRADLIAVDLDSLHHQPLFSIASQLVYTSVGHRVSHVWVDGKTLVEEFEHRTFDIEALRHKTDQWQSALSEGTTAS